MTLLYGRKYATITGIDMFNILQKEIVQIDQLHKTTKDVLYSMNFGCFALSIGVSASIVMLRENQSKRTRIGTKFSKFTPPLADPISLVDFYGMKF